MTKTIRRFIGVLVLLLSYVIPSNAQQPFYVYRNDGVINAFFTNEVDSIVYSQLDLDSMFHHEYLVQEIYTRDSIYRIPLELIDSIGYITPETVYQPGVIVLEGEIRKYITSSDSLTILFSKEIPHELLPRIGDKLVTTEISDVFFAGFAGRVENIMEGEESIVVECAYVGLDEVFEYFYHVSNLSNKDEHVPVKGMSKAPGVWVSEPYSPGTIPLRFGLPPGDYEFGLKDDLALQFSDKFSVSITPTYYGKAMLIVSPRYGVVVSLDITEEDMIVTELSSSRGIKWEPEIHRELPVFSLGIPFLCVYTGFGAFLRADAAISINHCWKQKFRYTFHYEVGNLNFFAPRASINGVQLNNEYDGEGVLNGSFGGGFFLELGVAFFDRDLVSTAFRGEVGIKLQGNAMIYKKDTENALHSTDLYEQLKGSEVAISGFYNIGLQAKLIKLGWNYNFNKPEKSEMTLWKAGIVPTFSDTKLQRAGTDAATLFASSKVAGYCLPSDLGFTLYEREVLGDGETGYVNYGYKGPNSELYASFFDVSEAKRYEVYPTVKLFGIEMLAKPSAILSGITFKDASILNVKSDPRYNSDGEYLFTSYTAQVKYVIQIDGSEEIKSIQPIIYNNSDWSYSGNKVSVPGDGLFSINTALNYDNNAEMDFTIGYEVNFTDGTSVKSTNCLHFSGTHENPIVTIEDNPSSAKALARTSNIRHENISSSQIVQIE